MDSKWEPMDVVVLVAVTIILISVFGSLFVLVLKS